MRTGSTNGRMGAGRRAATAVCRALRVWTILCPMRALIFILCLLVPAAAVAAPDAPEYVTAPVEATVKVAGENYYKARRAATAKAFRAAVYHAIVGMAPPGELEERKELIEDRLIKRSQDFVSGYKYLEQITDHAENTLTVRMQVTLFLDAVRAALVSAGVGIKKHELPRLAVLIREQSAGLVPNGAFLMLSSRSEEIIARAFRQRGFPVADREEARKGELDKLSAAAVNGDALAAAAVGKALGADMMLFGDTVVTVMPASEGDIVEVSISVTVRKAPDGAVLLERVEVGKQVCQDILRGSLETIESTAQVIAKDLAIAVSGKWLEIREGADGESEHPAGG